MAWTIERITELCIEYCGRCGVKFDSPVVINGRLTRTLGRCFYSKTDDIWNPTKIEISRQLLETATDESITAVIAHECAHYVTCAITHHDHGHDAIFRHYCEMIGTTNDTAVYDSIEQTKSEEEIYKYTIYCCKCGKLVGGRSRACNLTKYPENYYSNCCHADLRVVKNW
jgi:predicted SprT family Zn-dependent metalloprotease